MPSSIICLGVIGRYGDMLGKCADPVKAAVTITFGCVISVPPL
jgi:hypothetical protein